MSEQETLDASDLDQYMGVPVPSAHDLLGGVKRLANILS